MTALYTRIFAIVVFSIAAVGCAGRVNDEVWRPFALWATKTAIGQGIARSSWLFAVVESFHLTALAVLGGAVLIVDLRLLGFGLTDQQPRDLSRSAEPWLWAGLVLAVISGTMLFLSEGLKFYGRGFWDSAEAPFIYKMLFLVLAVLFTFTIRRTWLRHAEGSVSLTKGDRIVAAVSLLLWLGVAVGGRAIGFY